MRTEDGHIIQQCLDGNAAAFGFLVDKYKRSVYALAYSEIRNFHDAQDITQEAFIKAYQKLRTLRRWDNFMGWLYRITANLCRDWRRSKSKQPDREFVEDQEPDTLDRPSMDLYSENMAYGSIRETLESLPDTYQQVLTLRYFGGMNIREMSKFLCLSPRTVDRRLREAHRRLREEIVAMIGTTYEQHELPGSFTFCIVEAVKRIKINSMPRTTSLPWGLSLAAGIFIVVLSLGTHLNISNSVEMPISLIPSDTEMSKPQAIPVDLLTGPQMLAGGNMQGNGGKENPDPEMNAYMAPQGEDSNWAEKAGMQIPRFRLSSSAVDGKIYIFGGIKGNPPPWLHATQVEVYDPETDAWENITNMPTPRDGLSSSAVDGIIYTIGGWLEFSAVEAYDPATDIWEKKTNMPTQRMAFSASVVDGIIYVIGGCMGDLNEWVGFTTVEAYNPATDTWERKADMPTGRAGLSCSVVDGKIYAIGGASSLEWIHFSTVEVYDPATDTWEEKQDMPTPRYGLSTSVLGGKIYAIGGGFATVALPTVEVYDPATDTWTKERDMGFARDSLTTSVVDGKIYAIGGSPVWVKNFAEGIVEEFEPGFRESQNVSTAGKIPTTWGKVRTAQ